MLLVVIAVLLVATVPLAGGRLAALADLRLRGAAEVAAALAAQVLIVTVAPHGSHGLRVAVHLCTYLVAGRFVLRNRHVPGMSVLGVGAALNLLAIAANGGVMPASPEALQVAGLSATTDGFVNSTAVEGARLLPLGDVFAVPEELPLSNVFSLGDGLLVAGGLWSLHRLCGSRPFRRRRGQRTSSPPRHALLGPSPACSARAPAAPGAGCDPAGRAAAPRPGSTAPSARIQDESAWPPP